MKNILITIAVIFGVYLLFANFDNNGRISSADNDRISELESCLDEYKSALSEYKWAVDEAHSNLSYWSEGDDYNDLISAIQEATNTLDIGDRTPSCD